MEAQEPKTIEQIRGTLKAARDSVWVVTDELSKMAAAGSLSKESRGNIQRNVDHLKLVLADQEIIDSGETVTDLQTAVTDGTEALTNNPET